MELDPRIEPNLVNKKHSPFDPFYRVRPATFVTISPPELLTLNQRD